MAKFIETFDGEIINLDTVGSFKPKKDSVGTMAALDMSGDLIGYVYRSVVQSFADTGEIVPAAPGFMLLEAWPQDDGTFWINKSPVIAWGIDCSPHADFCEAYSFDGSSRRANTTCLDRAVLGPDGVVRGWAGTFDSVEEWEKSIKASRTKAAE